MLLGFLLLASLALFCLASSFCPFHRLLTRIDSQTDLESKQAVLVDGRLVVINPNGKQRICGK